MVELRRGSGEALGALYERWGARLYNYLVRLAGRDAAEDLVQETFVRVLRSHRSYDPSRGFSGWLYAIATNAARTYLARSVPAGASVSPLVASGALSVTDPPAAPRAGPLSAAQDSERAEMVRAALAKLDPREREVVLLRHYQGLKFAEIARVTNANLSTVKSRMRYALDKLGRMLTKFE
jgi:RNA polymerase sigma-70 factor (ECF subfamily)